MSKKQWLVLLMLFLTYLLVGAFIFHNIEGRHEQDQIDQAKEERININALLHKHCMPGYIEDQHEILEELTAYCGKSVYNYTEGEVDRHRWNFYNSFYFSYTVVSTIGYGNLAPTITLSRILMIFYGLVGIPMNGILLTQLGEFFSQVFIRAHRKYKSYKQSYSDKKPLSLETRKVGLAAQIFMYLTPGFIIFIFFPAFLFRYYEGWTYDQAVYYAFVTLTTIGFGDIVAGQDNTKGSGPLFIMYQTFVICWISFGLGYIVMIMTFIARGMRSKKITRLEHKLAMNLKHTQSKIWNEFNKEVNYLRRVFNELQLSKVKRVYVDECEYEILPTKLSRSNSFPDLRTLTLGGCIENYVPPHPRRRANSEVVPDQLTRVVSETDLQRIDKNATFAAHAMVQPAELLARLVNILGYIPPPLSPDDMNDWDQDEDQSTQIDTQNDQYKTVNSFSSTRQGLPKVSQWRIGGERFPFTKPRSRATSEIRLHVTKNDFNVYQQNSEWTWSGPAASKKLQELMKARDTTPLPASKDSSGKSYRFPSFALPISATKNFFPRWRRQSKRSDTDSNIKNTDKIVVDDNEKNSQQNSIGLSSYLDERRDSTAKRYYTHTGGNLSNYLEGNTLLEETSLADFLRALTSLHARVGTVPDEYVAKPKRKLGTASLTPPKLSSLFTLFSPSSSGSGNQSNQNTVTGPQSYQSSRRVSLRTPESYHSGSNASSFFRRESVAVKPRRFSLRPVTTPVSPPTPPDYGSARLPNLHPLTLRVDDLQDLQEPYASTETFISVSPKEPLVNMEGPLSISSPIKPSSNIRRFSIRPAQLSAQPSPTSTTPLHISKPPPRWKAGILQRQLGQMNLQRRVRASSLSDVETSKREKSPVPLSPLAMDNTNKFVDISRVNQKTVTIMSPAEKMTSKNEVRNPAVSAPATSSVNPFVLKISNRSPTVSKETVISHVDSGRRQRNGGYDNPSSDENVLEQRLVNLNDTLSRTVQTGMQETNVDVKTETSLATEKQSGVSTCVIDNLNESRDSLNVTSSTSDCSGSKKAKPSVSIDFYKPSRQVIIEKPAVNPFEQYRAMTRSSQKEDMDLKEVKVEYPRAKRDETEN